MKVVLLFFCAFFGILIVLLTLIVLSSIRLNIEKCDISNFEDGKKKKLDINLKIYIEFYLFGLIKIAKIRITKKLISKMNLKTDMDTVKKDAKIVKQMHPIYLLKKLKITVEKFILNLQIGTDDVVFTAYLTGIISSVIRNITWNYKSKKKIF